MRYKITTLKNSTPHTYTLWANSKEEAIQKAQNRDGIEPLEIKEQSFFFQPIFKKEILLSLQQLHFMISAHLPLQQCLSSLTLHTRNKNLSKIFQKISDSLENGLSLYESFAPYEQVFGKLTLVMLEFGSKSGKLTECLEILLQELKNQEQHQKNINKALAYPCFVLTCTLLCFGILLQMVIPQFVELFAQNQLILPLPTKLLIAIQSFFAHYGILLLITLSIALGIVFFELKSKGILYQPLLSFALHLPIFGKLLHSSYLYQYTFTLSILLQSGIDLHTATTLAQSSIPSKQIKSKLQIISQALLNGKTLATAMQESRLFSPMMTNLIQIAQQTGKLQEALNACANNFQEDNQARIHLMISMIEPLFTLLLGIFVLFLALGIFMPIWNLS